MIDRIWLITGGCGFIGTNLIDRLRRLRPEIRTRVLDNLSVGRPDRLHDIELLKGDVRDPGACARACRGVETIVHLAASTGVAPSIADPRIDLESNVIGTFNMLEASRQAGVKKFLYASSGAALGEVPPPFHEEQAPHPASPYGASKLSGEGYCLAYEKTFGIDTVILRFSNVYGPHSFHKKSVIAKFFKTAIQGGPLVIFGDGSQTRDFIYVDDLCRGLLQSVEGDSRGNVFQIATNRETTVRELATRIQALVGGERASSLPIRFEPERQGDVRKNYADTAKARKILGFVPEVDLDTGLRRTYDYFCSLGSRLS